MIPSTSNTKTDKIHPVLLGVRKVFIFGETVYGRAHEGLWVLELVCVSIWVRVTRACPTGEISIDEQLCALAVRTLLFQGKVKS